MNLGIYKNFIVEDEEEGLLDILKNFESGQDIDDLKVKSANAKTVVYIVLNSLRSPRRSKYRFLGRFSLFRVPFRITSEVNPFRPVPIHLSPTKANQFCQRCPKFNHIN